MTGNDSLTVTSSVVDTSATTDSTLSYTNSSDVNSLAQLGIAVNSDGTLSLDVNSLDSILNTDFSSVAGFFQAKNSWGANLTTILNNVGTSSTTGLLSLANAANSKIEKTLHANISREDVLISSESKSIYAELTSANEVLQGIPYQLSSVNELYSAITGYNTSSN